MITLALLFSLKIPLAIQDFLLLFNMNFRIISSSSVKNLILIGMTFNL